MCCKCGTVYVQWKCNTKCHSIKWNAVSTRSQSRFLPNVESGFVARTPRMPARVRKRVELVTYWNMAVQCASETHHARNTIAENPVCNAHLQCTSQKIHFVASFLLAKFTSNINLLLSLLSYRFVSFAVQHVWNICSIGVRFQSVPCIALQSLFNIQPLHLSDTQIGSERVNLCVISRSTFYVYKHCE